jgi:hypothetical protein
MGKIIVERFNGVFTRIITTTEEIPEGFLHRATRLAHGKGRYRPSSLRSKT